jgi:hypothetical protein
MNMRRLYSLLAAWCFFLALPGMLSALGMFGPMSAHSTISGTLVLFWVVGYLAQFALFMWIMQIAGKQANLSIGMQLLLWLLASLLPWAIDWSLPVSLLFALLWLPIMGGAAVWIARSARREESLREHGIRALGVVLEVLEPRMNVVVNDVYIKRKVRVRVEREDGAPAYEGMVDGLFMLGEIPSPGDTFPLLVDPANPERIEYDKRAGSAHTSPVASAAPSSSGSAVQRLKHGMGARPKGSAAPVRARPPRFDYENRMDSPSRTPVTPSPVNERVRENLVDELEKLTDLRDRGAITDSEFDAAKKKLLGD